MSRRFASTVDRRRLVLGVQAGQAALLVLAAFGGATL
jgi:hypothetical protein